MIKNKCFYPGCKKEQENKQNLRLIDEEDSSVDLGFCKYHSYIVMGRHFKVKVIELMDDYEFELIGPFKEVEISEQVYSAIELIKLESDDKK